MQTPETPAAGDSAGDPRPAFGYVLHERKSPLTAPWEPIFAKHADDVVQLAVRVREAHCNGRAMAHGGLIAALADNAMGLSAVGQARAAGLPVSSAVTVSLTVDYIGTVRAGQWLEFVPVVVKVGRTLAFVEFRALADGEVAARGSATFKFLKAKAAA
ncbi:MAG: hypothetical protein RJA99_4306 [Pseudomonadota bacterium]|jgi:uncharacterized protein (TIGR00369 family)